MSRNDNLISQRNVAQGGAATPACGDQHDSLTNILNGTASWALIRRRSDDHSSAHLRAAPLRSCARTRQTMNLAALPN